jgi:hypothetical protein
MLATDILTKIRMMKKQKWLVQISLLFTVMFFGDGLFTAHPLLGDVLAWGL